MTIRKVVFIAERYPNKNDPSFPFLKNLVDNLSKHNNKCIVIAPQSIGWALLNGLKFSKTHYYENDVEIYRPLYFSFGGRTDKINYYFFKLAVKNIINKIDNVDVVYCKFWRIAFITSMIVKNSIPIIVDCGEGTVGGIKRLFNNEEIQKLNKRIDGIVYVSTKNLNESLELKLQDKQPYIIATNCVDKNQFNYKDKLECRKKLKLEENDFIVSFVGSFDERKGVKRLSEALTKLNLKYKIHSCFIGSGPLRPTCQNIIFEGKLNHNEIPNYLSASDIFVLPTLAEGCCNAVIEAGACGLPIVSTNKDFNLDVLNEDNSVLIDDPLDIDEIYNSIEALYLDEQKRKKLSENIQKSVENLTIENRAESINSFINKVIETKQNKK